MTTPQDTLHFRASRLSIRRARRAVARQFCGEQVMLDSAWLVPLCPLAGAVLNGFFGRRYRPETVGQIAIAAVGLSFLLSLAITIALTARPGTPASGHLLHLDRLRHVQRLGGPAARRPLLHHDAGGQRRRPAGAHLFHRLHARRRGPGALLHLPEPVRRRHAHPGDGGQLPADVRRLGRRGAVLLPADRLLVHAPERQRRRQKGLCGQPGRGRGFRAGGAAAVRHLPERRFPRRAAPA